jgi:hypothetical protein
MEYQVIAAFGITDHLFKPRQNILFGSSAIGQYPDIGVLKAEKGFKNTSYIGYIINATLQIIYTIIVIDAYK